MRHEKDKLIFLIGFMGSGKSHEGKLLSHHLGIPFIDLDAWIEEKEAQSITTIFSEKGELVFREKEQDALRKVYQLLSDSQHDAAGHIKYKGIVATGGGAPCFFDNMNWMNEHGLTIWLNLPETILAERLKNEKSKRPLIAGKTDQELKVFIADKLSERSRFYQMASMHITDLLDISILIQKIKDA